MANSASRRAATRPRLTLDEVMAELEAAGHPPSLKTYRRHGVTEPTFGVRFATLKTLMKRIDVDHELALALWQTGNFDARNLAVKIIDSSQLGPDEFDRLAREVSQVMGCGVYASTLAGEGPHGRSRAEAWRNADHPALRLAAWPLISFLALRDEGTDDAWYLALLGEIEDGIHTAPNAVREAMNRTVIAIGCRNVALRDAAITAAARIGPVDVDHGDTACETPDARAAIDKAWAHSLAKGFASPAAQERDRDLPRRRC